jgi:heat shock protein HslJ
MIKKSKVSEFIKLLICISFSSIYLGELNQAIANEKPVNPTQNQTENTLKIPLNGTEWQLVDWSENQPLTKEISTIAFEKDSLSGSSSCNRYFAGYTIQEHNIQVGVIGSTRKACPEEIMTQEMLFLSALEGAKIYTINAQGQLQIAYIKQKEIGILVFNPITNNNTQTINKTVYISPETVDCIGLVPQQCLQMKEKIEDQWTLFYQSIEGFNYEPGYLYQMRIAQKKN